MSEQGTTRHAKLVRCPTCGSYATPESPASGPYCSAACAEKYHRCITCGGYYPASSAASPEHCSRECAARYTLQRSYGPAQIAIRMEDLV